VLNCGVIYLRLYAVRVDDRRGENLRWNDNRQYVRHRPNITNTAKIHTYKGMRSHAAARRKRLCDLHSGQIDKV